ncbi:MAG: thiamine-binding protein [Pseudomonadales bacterium]|nr:thiamine-binding protein [Pseudomonadales bacterium]
MDIGVEVSLYPLDREFVPVIAAFIERLNLHPGLKVVTSSMSTQIFGPYDSVMAMLAQECRTVFERADKSVFVLKIIGPYAP